MIIITGARELWRTKAPNKQRFHFWLVLHERCWTSERLQRHGLQHHGPCALCSQEVEDLHHLLLHCVYSRGVWFKCLRKRRYTYMPPHHEEKIGDWWLRTRAGISKPGRSNYDSLVILTTLRLWLERNARIFNNATRLPCSLVEGISQDFELWGRARIIDVAL